MRWIFRRYSSWRPVPARAGCAVSAAARPVAGEVGGAWASRCSAVLITGRPATVEAWWPVTVVPPGLGALVGPGPQAAQQDSFETSVRKDWAAIFTPSAIVRYGHHKVATWSTVIPADKM